MSDSEAANQNSATLNFSPGNSSERPVKTDTTNAPSTDDVEMKNGDQPEPVVDSTKYSEEEKEQEKSKKKDKKSKKHKRKSRNASSSESESRSPSRSRRKRKHRRHHKHRHKKRSPSSSNGSDSSPSTSPRKRRHKRSRRTASSSYSRSPSRSRSRSYRTRYRPKNLRFNRGDREVREMETNPPPSRILGCFGLSQRTSERDLRRVFERYGRIEKLVLIVDRKTGISKGYGFVYFDCIEDATEAQKACNGMEMDGRVIRIDFSLTKRPHSPTPGTYLGRRRPYSGRPRGLYRYNGWYRGSYNRRRYRRSRSRSYSRSNSRSDGSSSRSRRR